VPKIGVTKVGEVSNTSAPDPVSPVTAAARFALEGVARKVATPVPSPETPVVSGKPVQLVSVPEVGVPKIGVTKVGEVASALAPLPVEVVTLVPPLATGKMPVTSVVRTTAPYEGAVEIPVERSTVLAAPLASFDRAVEPLAYRISPMAYIDCPVPPLEAVTEFWVARVPKPKAVLAVEASACLRNPVPDSSIKEEEPISAASPELVVGFPRSV
jgi:hypothetical protein